MVLSLHGGYGREVDQGNILVDGALLIRRQHRPVNS